MTGLYDGLEEVAFKRTARGWVFQTANPWLIGPKTRYFVTDAQKTEIAACIRGALRRIKPFAIGYAVLLPFLFVFGFVLLMFSGATISIAIRDDAGEATTTNSIHPTGATGIFAGPPGITATYSVDGPPGYGDNLTVNQLDASGKVVQTCVFAFAEGAKTTVFMKDAAGNVVRTAILTGHADLAPGHIWIWATLLGVVLCLPIFALPHAYSYRWLRPLVAGLPRSKEVITWREKASALAFHASPKFVFLMLFSSAVGLVASGANLVGALLHGHPILDQPALLVGVAASLFTLARFCHLAILRRKLRAAVR